MRTTVTISEANNYFRVSEFAPDFVKRVIMPFCRAHLYKTARVPIPGTRDTKFVVSHVFARFNKDKSELRLIKGLMKEFLAFIESQCYHQKRIKRLVEPELVGKDVKFEFAKGWDQPRENQLDWIKYQLEPGPLKINNATMGSGKTYMGIYSMVTIGKRTLICMQPRYIPVWLKDLGNVLKLKPEDVLLCETDLMPLADKVDQGLIDPKVIIVPMTRIEVFLRNEKEQEDHPSLDDVFRKFNVGLRIQDEAHEAIHQVYTSFLFGNVPKIIALSATMKSDDPFTNKIYGYVYPFEHRLKETEYTQYIDVMACKYRINMHKYRLQTQTMGSYNDTTFEKSIARSPKITWFYYQLMKKMFEEQYYKRRIEGTKCLIFFSKVDTCSTMCDLLKKDYPELDIVTFTGEDTKKAETKTKYKEHEVVVTTPGSCGTGKDIPGLITTLCLHTVSSSQRNDQILGRLRDTIFKMFNNLIRPVFCYFYCADIPKHVEYHNKRWALFEPKAATRVNFETEMQLD